MRYSPAVTMAAMAACSAQKPVPEAVSMQTPTYQLPASVTRAQATSPKSLSPTRRGLRAAAALSIRWSFWFTHGE